MQNEREIDALLSNSEAGSVIDQLMALPRPIAAIDGPNVWERAVSSRLEAHLARHMRSLIDGEDNRRSAA